MAAKKKTEVAETEVKEVESVEVAEEAPKKTTKKKVAKVEEVKEEVVEPAPEVIEETKEEPKAEVVEDTNPEPEIEVVGRYAVEVTVENKPEEKKIEPKVEAPKDSYQVVVVAPTGVYTFKNPSLDQPKGKIYARGSKLTVTEVKGNWGKVGEGKWVLLSGAVVKI